MTAALKFQLCVGIALTVLAVPLAIGAFMEERPVWVRVVLLVLTVFGALQLVTVYREYRQNSAEKSERG
jgi:hypothetical protein